MFFTMSLDKGLYDSLITIEIQQQIDELTAKFSPREKLLAKEDIADRISRVIGDWVNTVISNYKDYPDLISQEIAEAISDIISNYSLNENTNKPVQPLRVLTAIEEIDPITGDPIRIQEPLSPLGNSILHTNRKGSPRIGSLIRTEVNSADEISIILAFITYSGIQPLISALKEHIDSGKKIRILTTTFSNITETKALQRLEDIGAEVKVSYDTDNTRLHAKGWLFKRNSGLSTIYIGSSNLTRTGQITGREWNVKLSENTNGDVIQEFERTFNQYWENSDFKSFDAEKFEEVTKYSKADKRNLSTPRSQPKDFQIDILEKLQVDRNRGFKNNLVVAATGTGKTWVSAFDFAQIKKEIKNPKLLFVAHRKEILEQSRNVFREVIEDNTFGELWVGGESPKDWNHVFGSIQSINRNGLQSFTPNHFDVVIIDEFHHAGANI